MSTINSNKIEVAARSLRESEANRKAISPLAETLGELSEIEAYAIQKVNADTRIAAGERIVGRKIGLTSTTVQKQLGVDQPDFGSLFAQMAYGDSEPIPLDSLIQPKVEGEIALVLGRDLNQEFHTYADLFRAVDYAVTAIEVVDSRIADWRIRYADTVADNGSSARFILGSRPCLLRHLDLVNCNMTLFQEASRAVHGFGAACMGNPLTAAVWLANRMVSEGTPLQAGDVILTGALGPMVPVKSVGSFEVEIEGMGSVRAVFA